MAVALSLICGYCIVADYWLSYSHRLLAVEVMGMAFAVVGLLHTTMLSCQGNKFLMLSVRGISFWADTVMLPCQGNKVPMLSCQGNKLLG